MGTCGWAVLSQGRFRRALYDEALFPCLPYLVHLKSLVVLSMMSGSVIVSVRASTPRASCTASDNDRCRLIAAGGGPIVGCGASCTGGAAVGPVEMTVPVAGNHGTC